MNQSCSTPILALSDNKTSLHSAVNAMRANRATYIPAGLAWGWRVLSKEGPFTEARSYTEMKKKDGQKVIVLMSDGDNTVRARYPTHQDIGGVSNDANRLTGILCRNIKNKDIVIYTIAFEVSNATARNLLQNCATSPGHYFDARNSAQLAKAFEDIANQLSQLRLAR